MEMIARSMDEEKAIYNVFVKKATVPIYSEPWWLDAVCLPENWGVHVIAKSGQYIAAMPFYLSERSSYHLITKAHLTQNNGIIINYPKTQKYCSRLHMEESVINEMCDYIESMGIDKYEQQYQASFTNWLPFFWRGYQETTRYTYIIDKTKNMEEIRSEYSDKLRNILRNARKRVHLDENIGIEEFYNLIKQSGERNGDVLSYSYNLLKRLYDTCREHESCKIVAARNENDVLCGAILLVWDKEYVYYLIGGSALEYRHLQANTFLLDYGIEFANTQGKSFDFEGSMLRAVERAYRDYGARQIPYFRISKIFNADMPNEAVDHWSEKELLM